MITRPWEKNLNIQQSMQTLQNLQQLGSRRRDRRKIFLFSFLILCIILRPLSSLLWPDGLYESRADMAGTGSSPEKTSNAYAYASFESSWFMQVIDIPRKLFVAILEPNSTILYNLKILCFLRILAINQRLPTATKSIPRNRPKSTFNSTSFSKDIF